MHLQYSSWATAGTNVFIVSSYGKAVQPVGAELAWQIEPYSTQQQGSCCCFCMQIMQEPVGITHSIDFSSCSAAMSAAVQCVRRQRVVTYRNEAMLSSNQCILMRLQIEQERSMSNLCFLLLHKMVVAQGSEA